MTTFAAVIRAAIPDADEALMDHVLWSRTPYPVGRVTARSLFRAAARLRRAHEHGIQLCTFCDRIARPGGRECAACDEALRGEREEEQ